MRENDMKWQIKDVSCAEILLGAQKSIFQSCCSQFDLNNDSKVETLCFLPPLKGNQGSNLSGNTRNQ